VRQKVVNTVVVLAAAGFTLGVSGCGSPVPISGSFTSPAPPCTKPGPLSQADSFTIPMALTTTSTGLRYADISVGCGASARTGQVVTVQYTAWFPSGQRFDTSRVPGHRPLIYQLGGGRIIPGLDQAATGMKVGGKRRVEIPPSLAFGANGQGTLIPPNATLVMNLELVGVSG
jgi:FKBP-type peptidyl-prolyl cis-trans isomerase